MLVERFGERTRDARRHRAVHRSGLLWLTQLSQDSGYLSVLGPLVLVGLGNGSRRSSR